MRQREINRRAARRIAVDRELMARCVGAWLREIEELVAAGEPVSLFPLGRIQPIELTEDRRRKRRGVRFRPTQYFSQVMGRYPLDDEGFTVGPITRVDWGES